MNELVREAENLRETLIRLRREIHVQPEYGFYEFKTANLIAETLGKLNARVTEDVAKTGVVAEIGTGLPIVAIRADMDALPIQEETGLPFASCTPEVK